MAARKKSVRDRREKLTDDERARIQVALVTAAPSRLLALNVIWKAMESSRATVAQP